MANYLCSRSLTYQIILSQGKGSLTPEAEEMILLMMNNLFKKFAYRISDVDDKFDIFQFGVLHTFEKGWKTFDREKYNNAFPFLSEVIKRSFAMGFNIVFQKRFEGRIPYYPKFLSIDQAMEGKGMNI